ncbi:hypothetical protein QTP88_003045 [Uroleucon formosanum]
MSIGRAILQRWIDEVEEREASDTTTEQKIEKHEEEQFTDHNDSGNGIVKKVTEEKFERGGGFIGPDRYSISDIDESVSNFRTGDNFFHDLSGESCGNNSPPQEMEYCSDSKSLGKNYDDQIDGYDEICQNPAVSLCRVEFADFVNVCDNWTTLLQGTSQTFTSCQNTENIFTSATSVHTREELVGAPSSFEEYFGIGTEDIDFVAQGYLGQTERGVLDSSDGTMKRVFPCKSPSCEPGFSKSEDNGNTDVGTKKYQKNKKKSRICIENGVQQQATISSVKVRKAVQSISASKNTYIAILKDKYIGTSKIE